MLTPTFGHFHKNGSLTQDMFECFSFALYSHLFTYIEMIMRIVSRQVRTRKNIPSSMYECITYIFVSNKTDCHGGTRQTALIQEQKLFNVFKYNTEHTMPGTSIERACTNILTFCTPIMIMITLTWFSNAYHDLFAFSSDENMARRTKIQQTTN